MDSVLAIFGTTIGTWAWLAILSYRNGQMDQKIKNIERNIIKICNGHNGKNKGFIKK